MTRADAGKEVEELTKKQISLLVSMKQYKSCLTVLKANFKKQCVCFIHDRNSILLANEIS